MIDLPIPPIELRELVGLIDPAGYENHGRVPCFEEMGVPAGLIQSFSTAWALADASPSPEVPLCRASPPACRRESTDIRQAATD